MKLSRSLPLPALLAAALLLVIGSSAGWLRAHLRSRFDDLHNWQIISGRWSESGGVVSNSNYGRGDMIIAPHSQGGNYRISADIRFDLYFSETQYGDAGLAIRTTDPQPGVDSYEGYYAGIRPSDQTLILGRASYDWDELAHARLAQPIVAGNWYHLELAARDCNLAVTVTPLDTKRPPTHLEHYDPQCLTAGASGLRSFYTQASWRNVHIESF